MTDESSDQRLGDWLRENRLGANGRLPPERELAVSLGLSRTALRTALASLESEGRLIRQVGRGTFMVGPQASAAADRQSPSPPTALAEVTSPRDLLQARQIVEPELARLAALNATSRGMKELRAQEADIAAARTWPDYDATDARFHRRIAELAGNRLLLSLHLMLEDVRCAIDWGGLLERGGGPSPEHASLAEHAAITAAILARDAHRSADAMRHHLIVEASSLMGQVI